VTALALDPTTPTTAYAGTRGGGVFKTTDGAATWTAVTNGLGNLTVSALAVAPSAGGTLLAATDGGVFRTTDGGGAWAASSTGLSSLLVRGVAFSGSQAGTAYAGTEGGDGMFKSIDGGRTWSAINVGLPSATVWAVAADPSRADVVLAGLDGGLYRSMDGGTSWTRVQTGNVRAIAFDTTAMATAYAGLQNQGVFKSVNGTDWSNVSTGLNTSVSSLAIHPQTPTILYAGTDAGVYRTIDGANSWMAAQGGMTDRKTRSLVIDTAGRLIAGTEGGQGTYRSLDGMMWTVANTGLANVSVQALAVHASSPTNLYAGTDSGVWKSINAGSTWGNVLAQGLVVRALAIDPMSPASVFAGGARTTTSGPTLYHTEDGARSWSSYSSVQSIPVTSILLLSMPMGQVFLATEGSGLMTGNSAANSFSGVSIGDSFIHALAADPSSPMTLYAGTRNSPYLYKSINGGNTWLRFADGLPMQAVNALVAHPLNPGTVYAATGAGVYRTVDGGIAWTAQSSGIGSVQVDCLVMDPANPSTLYAATASGVYRTTDAGNAWSAVGGPLPNKKVMALLPHPTDGRTLFVGTDGNGVYVSGP